MLTETLTTDGDARLTLPASFASSTVTVEHVSDTELVVRKAPAAGDPPEPEGVIRLSDRDWEAFTAAFDDPPPPNDALRAAAARPPIRRG